jgi:hypothetical protein
MVKNTETEESIAVGIPLMIYESPENNIMYLTLLSKLGTLFTLNVHLNLFFLNMKLILKEI